MVIVDGNRLTINLRSVGKTTRQVLALPDDAVVFDIADIDNDRRAEVVAICSDRVMRFDILPATDSAARPSEELLEQKTLFTELESVAHPVPRVIVVSGTNGALLALPREDVLELRRPDGALVESCPFEKVDDPYSIPDFFFRSRRLPEIGPGEALEMTLAYDVNLVAKLPERFKAANDNKDSEEQEKTRSLVGLVLLAGELYPGESPWKFFSFGIVQNEAASKWAFGINRSRFSPLASQKTTIRIVERRIREADSGDQTIDQTAGPERTYPGWPMRGYERYQPDFDNDGYTDLGLLRAPAPGLSVNSLTKALTGAHWPLILAVHLFLPEDNRFDPRSAAAVKMRVPVAWFVENRPLRNAVMRDFDGDGHTDFACSPDENQFAVWLYKDGFGREPDFEHRFDQPIDQLVFHTDLAGDGRTSLVLRTENAFHILYARP